MSEFDPKIDATFLEYADLELRCHNLLLAGREDSDEIAEAEDRMENLWPQLDDVQQRSLRGMASDLSWIRRKSEPPPKGRKTPEEVAATERQELWAAMKSREWHRVLHYLRLCAPTFQAASLARERGIAYDAIGFPNYARVFDAYAIEFVGTMAVVAAVAYDGIVLPNYARVFDANAIELAPTNAVVVWEANGVKATARTATEDRLVDAVEYRACA